MGAGVAGVVGAGVVGAGVVGVVGAGVAGGSVDSPAGADVVAAPASVVDVTAPDPAVVTELSPGEVLFEAELLHAARASSSEQATVIRRVMRSFKHACGGPA